MRKIVLLLSMILIASFQLSAQNQRVSGTVTGPDGSPMAGVVVSVGGTAAGTVTASDGSYSANAPADGTLSFSFLGMVAQTVPVQGRTVINIQLEADAQAIDDVIVVAFGTATREAFTGSAGVINAEALSKRTSTNVISSLAGQVAGVQIRSDRGQPGEADQELNIRIRGFTSLNADNDPLIVVDGAPYAGNLSSINSADIETFTILKDASSSALYGARAANGVVMITTKRARRQEAVVSFDTRIGVGSRAAVDYDYITDPGEHYERLYAGFHNYAAFQGSEAYPDPAAWANEQTLATVGGYKVYDTGTEPLIVNGKLNPNAKLGNTMGDYYLLPDDWRKEAYKNSSRQEYNLNVNGGNERATYYLSMGYLNDEGIVAKSSYERYSARLKGDYQVKKWLRMGANIAYSATDKSMASGYDDASLGTWSSGNIFVFPQLMAPVYPVYLRDAKTRQIMVDERGMNRYDWGQGDDGPDGLTRSFLPNSNPLAAVLLDDDSAKGNTVTATGYAEISIIEGLKVNLQASKYFKEERLNNFTNPWYGQYASSGGTLTKQQDRDNSLNLIQTITYAKKIGGHNFEVLLGHESYTRREDELWATKDHMFGTDIHELALTVNTVGASSSAEYYNNEGYLAKGRYDYNNKYFADLYFRRDATSRFHPDHRWGNFWGGGASWLMSSEDFMSGVDWVDMLKLKASYGQVGNDKIGDFRYIDTFDIVSSNDGIALVPRQKGNPNITWETVASFNTGVEFDLFDSRLSGSIEYYNRTTYDQLFELPTAESSGFPNYFANVGDMRNSGIEIDLRGVAVSTRDLNLSFFANISTNKNKILRLPAQYVTPEKNGFDFNNRYYRTEGGSIYDWYIKEFAGVDPETGESLWYMDVEGTSEADAHMNPSDGRATTKDWTEATLYRRGNAMPKMYGGFGSTFAFYGFDLSVSFDYQIGGKGYDADYANLMRSIARSADGMTLHKDLAGAWTPTNTSSDIPRFQFNDAYSSGRSTRFLTDMSYLSLSNINLGYTFPARWTDKLQISSARIYCTAENIHYWSKRKGFDPRQQYDGTAMNYTYSPIRTISGGLQLTF